jgi:hypothetical protein
MLDDFDATKSLLSSLFQREEPSKKRFGKVPPFEKGGLGGIYCPLICTVKAD